MKRERPPRDERLSLVRYFLREFSTVFVIIFILVYIMVLLYNKLLRTDLSIPLISLFMLLNLCLGCSAASVAIYFFRVRTSSRRVQEVCRAAQKVAHGDFSVRVEAFKDKAVKTEIDLLMIDFNTMVEELESIEMLRDGFVADVSHEIKTPLSIIQGYADLLQNTELSNSERREYIQLLHDAVYKLNTLVTNLLKLNKIENQGIIQPKTYSLSEQVRNCVVEYIDITEEKNITLDIDIDDAEIFNDETMLELVWNNLLANAVKFTENGGKISVAVKNSNSGYLVSVSDNGCGIEPEALKHIFEKFYQGDTSHSQEGNGLGLALVKRIAVLTKCGLNVESKSGDGTRFDIAVPYSCS